MHFKWNPSQEDAGDYLLVKCFKLESIKLKRDEVHSFASLAEYAPYRARFEGLVQSGLVSIVVPSSAKAEKKPAAPKEEPAPVAVAEEPAVESPAEESAPSEQEAPAEKALEDLSVSELKKLAKEKNLEFSNNAKKSDLVALLKG